MCRSSLRQKLPEAILTLHKLEVVLNVSCRLARQKKILLTLAQGSRKYHSVSGRVQYAALGDVMQI